MYGHIKLYSLFKTMTVWYISWTRGNYGQSFINTSNNLSKLFKIKNKTGLLNLNNTNKSIDGRFDFQSRDSQYNSSAKHIYFFPVGWLLSAHSSRRRTKGVVVGRRRSPTGRPIRQPTTSHGIARVVHVHLPRVRVTFVGRGMIEVWSM